MEFRILPAGDSALLVQLPARIDPAVSDQAVALAQAVRIRCGNGVRDLVVGFCSVTVYFDPLRIDAIALEEDLRGAAAGLVGSARGDEALIEVDVCYGAEYGPDLAEVAAFAHATEEEVIALHSAATYRVYVVGFVPGFPYMARVHPRLEIPRKATPRTRVPAGSVAIAAGQTGIYPTETPGGWHLIGRTRVKPYDASRPRPFLFKPGDQVRFRPIDRDEFERMN